MNVKKFYIIFTAGLIIVLTASAYLFKAEPEDITSGLDNSGFSQDHKKIIKFNHKYHLTEVGAKCQDCHTKASTSVTAKDNLTPLMAACGSCHDIKDEKNCNFCHYDNVYKKLKPTKRELNFSHKYHIETQKKVCTDCHQGLDKVRYANQSPAFFPAMDNCYTCHDEQKATNNCEACHTNTTKLYPKDHKQPNFLNEHKTVASTNSSNAKCMMCHSDNFCQVCHSAPGYTGNNTKENFFAPYYTKEGGLRMDRTALQKLSNVHDINYRNNHGLDARHKSYECKTCHEPVQFCASCHQDKGNIITGIMPQSHKQPNFTTMGVNTGGGLHSELAKKDIEACVSCHEVEGGDPVCVRCHYDNDGIKGSNPRTHKTNFYKDEKGIWHETEGAVCYVCHTDWNAKPNGRKGINFCGYCHN